MKTKHPRYIPTGSTPDSRNSEKGEVHTWSKDGKIFAVAYTGKQARPTWNYRFLTEANRAEKVNSFFDGIEARKKFRAVRHTERNIPHAFQVDDILYASWGYDQTNIDFFQIVAVTQKTVTFRKICQAVVDGTCGFMCENVIASKNEWLNDKIYTRPAHGDCFAFAEYKGDHRLHLSKWDGRPLYQSHYA